MCPYRHHTHTHSHTLTHTHLLIVLYLVEATIVMYEHATPIRSTTPNTAKMSELMDQDEAI